MPRYVIELTSANPVCPTQVEYEAADEAEALRHFISHRSPIAELLVERAEPQYKGWKKIELSIGPGVCSNCFFEPSPETEICADCRENAQ